MSSCGSRYLSPINHLNGCSGAAVQAAVIIWNQSYRRDGSIFLSNLDPGDQFIGASIKSADAAILLHCGSSCLCCFLLMSHMLYYKLSIVPGLFSRELKADMKQISALGFKPM